MRSWSIVLVLVVPCGIGGVRSAQAGEVALKGGGEVEPKWEPRDGFVLRMHGLGLAQYYGGAFLELGDTPVIPEAAFGFGGLLGFEWESRLLLGIQAELLMGGLDTTPLESTEGFANSESFRGTVGAAARYTFGQRKGLRIFVGVDANLMTQWVHFYSDQGRIVPLRSRYTGRIVGRARVPETELQSTHNGWSVGPVLGLRTKLTEPNYVHVDFFVEASLQYEQWDASGVDGSTFARGEALDAVQAVADSLESAQRDASSWATTIRIGIQFGP